MFIFRMMQSLSPFLVLTIYLVIQYTIHMFHFLLRFRYKVQFLHVGCPCLYPTVLYFVGAHEISSPPATPGVQILQTAGTVR